MHSIVKKWIFVLGILTLLLTACSTTDSENVNTEGIYAVFTIQEDGANATFYVGGITGTVLQLSSGDSVTCNGNALSEDQDIFGAYHYSGSCGALVTGNTYTFVFTRAVADADDEVYTSEVSLPAPVTINSPANNATFTRGNTIAVTWTAGTTDSITVSLSGSGNSSTSSGSASFLSSDGSLADDGSHTISSEDTNPDSITGAITNGVITVTRRRSGTMDTALDGSISASTEDSVTGITLNP